MLRTIGRSKGENDKQTNVWIREVNSYINFFYCIILVLCVIIQEYFYLLSSSAVRGGQPGSFSIDNPMAYGGIINGRRRGTREESRK